MVAEQVARLRGTIKTMQINSLSVFVGSMTVPTRCCALSDAAVELSARASIGAARD
jgi:hypothetical protein